MEADSFANLSWTDFEVGSRVDVDLSTIRWRYLARSIRFGQEYLGEAALLVPVICGKHLRQGCTTEPFSGLHGPARLVSEWSPAAWQFLSQCRCRWIGVTWVLAPLGVSQGGVSPKL